MSIASDAPRAPEPEAKPSLWSANATAVTSGLSRIFLAKRYAKTRCQKSSGHSPLMEETLNSQKRAVAPNHIRASPKAKGADTDAATRRADQNQKQTLLSLRAHQSLKPLQRQQLIKRRALRQPTRRDATEDIVEDVDVGARDAAARARHPKRHIHPLLPRHEPIFIEAAHIFAEPLRFFLPPREQLPKWDCYTLIA